MVFGTTTRVPMGTTVLSVSVRAPPSPLLLLTNTKGFSDSRLNMYNYVEQIENQALG